MELLVESRELRADAKWNGSMSSLKLRAAHFYYMYLG